MNNKIFLILIAVLIFNISGYDISAQDTGEDLSNGPVSREELEQNLKEVEFVNYMGPQDVIESKSDIMSIGRFLASSLSSGGRQASLSGKYRILHLTDPSEPEKMDGDIVIIEKEAKVDHIRNIRLIISSYLETMYGYRSEDSMLLAEFVTYYNAVFRGNIDFFSGRYINMIMTNISKENAGIDILYSNWPGNTRLIIPLKKSASGRPDPFELADKDVVEDLRKDEGMGVEQRKKIVEFQEEDLAEDKAVLAQKEEEIKKTETAVAAKEAAVAEKEKALDEKIAAGAVPEAELEETKKEIESEKAAVEKEKEKLSAEKEKTDEAAAEIEKKEDAIAESRESIAKDANKILEEKAAAESGESSLAAAIDKTEGIPFLRLEEGTSPRTGKFVFYNAGGSTAVPEGTPVTAGRLYLDTPSGYVVSAKDESGKFVLTRISTQDLTSSLQGTDEIWSSSFLLSSGSDIYCVAKSSGKWVIARYSADFKAAAYSDIEADPDTFIIKKDKQILFQNQAGKVLSVDAAELK